MSVGTVFEKLREALDAAGIPYFVTGSFASSAHGVPRSTNDIDLVIAPTREQLEQLLTLRYSRDARSSTSPASVCTRPDQQWSAARERARGA